MKTVRYLKTLREILDAHRRRHAVIGFVPTMGCLHEGHASLIRRARRECDVVVVSIFVNPLQFGPKEDFARYPRTEKKDRELCARAGADVVYAPKVAKFYAQPFRTNINVREITDCLCGKSRAGHFDGVATVVAKLFNQVQPDRAYFGKKDHQQVRVIEQMVRDLDMPVVVVTCPIVREADGLAMSSRNRYLNDNERARARVLHAALLSARSMIENGETSARKVTRSLERLIGEYADAVEYVEIRDSRTLDAIKVLRGTVVVAVAARFGGARLIDNSDVKVPA